MNDEDVCCRKFYEEFGNRVNKIQIFDRFKMVEFVDQQDSEKLPSCLEMERGRFENTSKN